MVHLHITSWALAIILLFVVHYLYKQNDGKFAKILHMILRLDSLIVIISGLTLFFSYANKLNGELIFKVIAGLWALISIEMITVKASKNQPAKSFWIQFVIAALLAILLGFTRLPLGLLP